VAWQPQKNTAAIIHLAKECSAAVTRNIQTY